MLEERAKELEAKLSDATAELGEERQSRQKVERELADEKARFERDLAAFEVKMQRELADHKAQFDRDLAAQLAQFRLLEERAKELEAKLSDATAELGEERQSRQKVERELADEKARFERDLAAQEAQLKSVEESARKTAASRDALQVCFVLERMSSSSFSFTLLSRVCRLVAQARTNADAMVTGGASGLARGAHTIAIGKREFGVDQDCA